MPGSWQPLNNPPAFNLDAMLLLTDGTVMCHEYETSKWHKLVPDKNSDYANGTFHPLASMPDNAPVSQGGPGNAPLYFASAVLRDGTVFCAGGEYNAGAQTDYLAAELYDPQTDVWTPLATPPGWTNIGDASSCVLPDGRVLLGNPNTNSFPQATEIWDPESRSWARGGSSLDLNSEEGWTLLPDGTVLAVQCTNVPHAQKYVIATNSWVKAGNTGATLPGNPVNVPPVIYEMGPQILLTDGRVFAIGASGHTAFYTPPTTLPSDPGSWAPGPDFPVGGGGQLMGAVDAPACLLPSGNVLCVVGSITAAGWSDPTSFFEFDPITSALIPIPGPAIAGISPTYNARLLLLPTGQVLYTSTDDSGSTFDIQIYTPGGGPQNAWRPDITHVPRHLHPGRVYRLHGRQLNGLSQACAYGDDQQMATNYPLVRLWGDPAVGAVYCRTFNHSTMGVATGNAIHHTHFEVPDHLQPGKYRLVVIANGIASKPVTVHVEHHEHHHDDCDEHGHDHDEEIVEFDHEESKYKDKDAKEAKEKEKDFKDVKEKDTKEFKDKDSKECKDKDKDCKECEEKPCKEKDCKEYEHKGCKEKECHEHSHYGHYEKRQELGELMHKVGRIAERIEHIEGELHRRPFIRSEERPSVGERALHHQESERYEGERREHERHEEERPLHAEQHRRMEQERLEEEERRRHEEERHGGETRSADEVRRAPENPGGTHESAEHRRAPGSKKH